jgi:hypothetical protein
MPKNFPVPHAKTAQKEITARGSIFCFVMIEGWHWIIEKPARADLLIL